LIAALVVSGCQALFAGDALSPSPTITPEIVTSAPAQTEDPIDDLDGDGIEDALDDDADGDGVPRDKDRDDEDPEKGKRKPKPKPKPEPEPEVEPEPVANAHPGGFCGTPGAVGIASNGRTYVCRDGHWRR
jgi:hypothetical protein